jgi:iron complex outermembrane receptor protein
MKKPMQCCILILVTTGSLFAQQKQTPDMEIKLRNSNLAYDRFEIKPLYVIDGVVYDSVRLASDTTLSVSKNPVALLNPEDIEVIEVFKNEKALEAYGRAAKDGVVVITTKRKKYK